MLEPPYNNRLDRPILRCVSIGTRVYSHFVSHATRRALHRMESEENEEEIDVAKESRADAKKDFDRAVFKQQYF